MNEYDPSDEQELIRLTEIEDDSLAAEDARREAPRRYAALVAEALAGLGYRAVVDTSRDGVDTPHQPQYLAELAGKPCCICMPEQVCDVPTLCTMSAEQCAVCDALYPEHEVHYAMLLDMGDALSLLTPHRVKTAGKWLCDELDTEQFLPFSMVRSPGMPTVLLGPAGLFKLFRVYIPYIAHEGKLPGFFITGLELPKLTVSSRYCTLRSGPIPTIMPLLRSSEQRKEVCGVFFYYENEHHVELELVDMPGEDPEAGLVRLMTEDGQSFTAACIEAVLYAPALPRARRYKWCLSLVPDKVTRMQSELSFDSGVLYEITCDQYRREHGAEPPDDFVARFSLENFRSIYDSSEDSADISFAGQVAEVRHECVFDREFVVAGVRFLHQDDAALVNVFLCPEQLEVYTPAVGDVIDCSGRLYAVPAELVADTASWQGSAGIEDNAAEKELCSLSWSAYSHFSKESIAMGVAASAFIRAGWEPVEDAKGRFSRGYMPLVFKNEDGLYMGVLVDTEINGQGCRFSYAELLDDARRIMRDKHGEHGDACLCTVSLNYLENADRYAVSMRMQPELAGVHNTLVYTGCAFEETRLCLREDGESEYERLRPEKLDEHAAARLLCDAVVRGEWSALAVWLREEMSYQSDTCSLCFTGKVDFLRYMSERVDMWKSLDVERMPRFSVGFVLYMGERRPAMASHTAGGRVDSIAIFDDSHGMVGHIHTLSAEQYPDYTPETEPERLA